MGCLVWQALLFTYQQNFSVVLFCRHLPIELVGTTQERKDLSGLLRILLSHPAIKSLWKRNISILEPDTAENSVVLWTP